MHIIDHLFVTSIKPAIFIPGLTMQVEGRNGPIDVPRHMDWKVVLMAKRGDVGDDVCVVIVTLGPDANELKLGDRIEISLKTMERQ